jgi:hypothetical protein
MNYYSAIKVNELSSHKGWRKHENINEKKRHG